MRLSIESLGTELPTSESVQRNRWLSHSVRGFMPNSRLGSNLLTRILPGSFFAVLLIAKGFSLFHFVQDRTYAGRLGAASFWLLVLYHVLVLMFFTLVVVLIGLRKPSTGRSSSIPAAIIALAGSFILTLIASTAIDNVPPLVIVTASILLLAGEAFALISLAYLGRCFGIFPAARGLIRGGPYRYVRHPLYLAEVVVGLGMLLPVFSLYTLVIFVAFCFLQYRRALYEEETLTSVFAEYAEYRQGTWRIIPWLH